VLREKRVARDHVHSRSLRIFCFVAEGRLAAPLERRSPELVSGSKPDRLVRIDEKGLDQLWCERKPLSHDDPFAVPGQRSQIVYHEGHPVDERS
jgi:hypothetical protein